MSTETENMLDDNEYPNVHVDLSTRAEFGISNNMSCPQCRGYDLERVHCEVCDRKGLVAGVVSMDKFKQKKKGEKAMSKLLKEAKQIKW